MDIQFYGANAIALTTKQARIVIDDNLVDLGGKSIAKADDIALFTGPHADPTQHAKIIIDQPGEYDVSGVSIYGIAARAHMDEQGKRLATMYKLLVDDLKVLVTGHIYPEISDKLLEQIGMIDVMIVPVGGNGYTLDPIGAMKLIKKIEPKLVIPVHYDSSSLQFPVPQQPLADALRAMAVEPKETVSKLKIKASELGDLTQVVVVES